MLSDLRFALRNLRRTPVFAVVAILSLALGFGTNTAIFSLLDQVLLRLLPVKNPQELVNVHSAHGPFSGSSRCSGQDQCLSYPMYKDLRDQNQVFSGILARMPLALSFSVGDRTERASGELVSGNYFDVLGVGAALGRTFTQDDDRVVSGGPLVVLSYDFWQRRFGGDPSILNGTVRVNDHPMTVIGVAQRGFQGVEVGRVVDVMVPMMMKPEMTPTWNDLDNRRSVWLYAIARLKPGVSRLQAETAMQVIWKPLLTAEAEQIPNNDASWRPIRGQEAFGRRRVEGPIGSSPAVLETAGGVDGDGRAGAIDRLRECRESAAGARGGEAEGNRGSPGAGRGARAGDPATAGGEHGACFGGRHRRSGDRVPQRFCTAAIPSGRPCKPGAFDYAGLPRTRFRDRIIAVYRIAVRSGSRISGDPSGDCADAQGSSVERIGGRRSGSHPNDAGGRAGGAFTGVAGRRGVVREKPL
jgi:hypothetical protein